MSAISIDILKKNKLRKTNFRVEVLNVFLEAKKAFSHRELEHKLKDADRITLYRTLKTFEQKGIIHEAHDGTDLTKYALCQQECTEEKHVDNHAHFHCQECGETTCIDKMEAPSIRELHGYQVSKSYLFLRGKCPKCAK